MDNNIRALREEKGLTLSALAKQIGINKGDLSRMERGWQEPDIDEVKKIARVLGPVEMWVTVQPRRRK